MLTFDEKKFSELIGVMEHRGRGKRRSEKRDRLFGKDVEFIRAITCIVTNNSKYILSALRN